MNKGIHTVDLLLWLLGPVRRVFARTATALHAIEVEDIAVAVLEFESGALATLEATTAAFPGYPRRIELSGTDGTAIVEDDRLLSIDVRSSAASSSGRKGPASQERSAPLNVSSPVVADVSGHKAVIEDFLDAIANDRPPGCDGIAAIRSVALVEAVYESARRGAAVDLTPAHA